MSERRTNPRLSIEIDLDLRRRLRAVAARDGRSIRALVTQMIESFLNEKEKELVR